MSSEKVVVSIGGSILIPDVNDSNYITELTALIRDVVSENIQLVVVCGGGKIARYYANTGRELGGNEYQLDELGIGVTRLNAGLLAISLGDISSTDIPLTAEDTASRSGEGNVIVMGGTEPGHTTDAVAAMVARALGAERIVNATSVDAVYSEDPKKNPDAERYSKLTIKELGNLIYKEHGASRSGVFDPLGVKIAEENHIDIAIVDGRNLDELKNAILGKEINGTHVSSK
ncbi:MAG: UMP kinase [Candidatus Methanoplasma sp.]|jgi:uridylate kinase|nr:UMP kinase [Candidatus Methanoplasma sp.]